ncbi:hypothetical protein KEJ15_07950 [Candidatus Bathyarchaeota archaeon]|nr:hypothetical protein [Candidatus Bathyarchaeota archaeon]
MQSQKEKDQQTKIMERSIIGVYLGIVLVIITLLLAVGQHFMIVNFYGDAGNKWYFWSLVAVIGLLGIAMGLWYYRKIEIPLENNA